MTTLYINILFIYLQKYSNQLHPIMTCVKKTKLYHFNNEWEEEFIFTMNMNKCVCLICNTIISLPKRGNLQRHFKSLHENFDRDFPLNSLIRKDKVKKLKTSLHSQQLIFKKLTNISTSATKASLRVTRILVQHKKPFTDGEIFKNAFLEAADSLFENMKNKQEIINSIQNMQLSKQTVTKRVENIASDIRLQLMNDFKICTCFSLQFDESTDACDTAQLSIFARLVFLDSTVKEELLKIIPMKERTTGEKIYNVFKTFISSENLVPVIKKLVSITTDGAPAMIGSNNGFIAFCRRDKEFPNFISYHCIIHQQALCGKMLNLNDVMATTIKIINSIRAKALQRRLFKCILEEVNAHYGDLLLHNEVRWLSKGLILFRFRQLLPHIKDFLNERKSEYITLLEDNEWLLKLAFLTDITTKLNELNIALQGKNKNISDMISSINSFKMKLKLWISQLRKNNLTHFSNIKDESDKISLTSNEKHNYEKFANVLEKILSQFQERFNDFNKISVICSFLASPFSENDIENVAEEIEKLFNLDVSDLQLEIIDLQGDIVLRSKKNTDLWMLMSSDKYPHLKDVYRRILSCFGSTYLCESSFSHMNHIKSKYRTRLSDNHLDDCLRLAISNYEPDYVKIAGDIQCQVSH